MRSIYLIFFGLMITVAGCGAAPVPSSKTALIDVDAVEIDGLVVSVGNVRHYTGPYCCSTRQGAIAFTVDMSITNSTRQPFDASDINIQAAFGRGRRQGTQILAADKISTPRGTVSPGRPLSATIGYAVPEETDITSIDVMVMPKDSAYVIFHGELGDS